MASFEPPLCLRQVASDSLLHTGPAVDSLNSDEAGRVWSFFHLNSLPMDGMWSEILRLRWLLGMAPRPLQSGAETKAGGVFLG